MASSDWKEEGTEGGGENNRSIGLTIDKTASIFSNSLARIRGNRISLVAGNWPFSESIEASTDGEGGRKESKHVHNLGKEGGRVFRRRKAFSRPPPKKHVQLPFSQSDSSVYIGIQASWEFALHYCHDYYRSSYHSNVRNGVPLSRKDTFHYFPPTSLLIFVGRHTHLSPTKKKS